MKITLMGEQDVKNHLDNHVYGYGNHGSYYPGYHDPLMVQEIEFKTSKKTAETFGEADAVFFEL